MGKFGTVEYIIVTLILRVVAPVVCALRAKKLNRNTFGWALFGFFAPLLAMIWIQFMKPKQIKSNEN